MNEARAPADRITSLDLTAAACIAALVWQKQMLAGPCACLMAGSRELIRTHRFPRNGWVGKSYSLNQVVYLAFQTFA